MSIPTPKEPYGIPPIIFDIIDIENILTSIIAPQLPDLRIRVICLQHDPSKYVYLIWHSKSWFSPHMVSGYKHFKYYKRGNFKTESMQEYEVRKKYEENILIFSRTEDYIKNIDYGLQYISGSSYVLKMAVVPLLLSPTSKYFNYTDAIKVIANHRRLTKISILDGILFISYPNRGFIGKVLFNGTAIFSCDIEAAVAPQEKDGISFKLLDIDIIKRFLEKTAIPYFTHLYNNISLKGPMTVMVNIENCENFLLKMQHQDMPITRHELLPVTDLLDYIYKHNILEFSEIFTTNDFILTPHEVIETILNRIKYALGGYNYNNE
jgi:hypothetical protein